MGVMESYGRLHPTQRRLLETLKKCDGSMPSLRELGRQIGILSPNTIAHHLTQLERKGYLMVNEDGEFRVVDKPLRDVAYLPLYGNAACGTSEFFAEDNVEELVPLPTRTFRIRDNYFLVRARGDSMMPKIHDKDLLIVERTGLVESGQLAVVTLEDGVYAKQVLHSKSTIILNSLNSEKYPPRPVRTNSQFNIIGLIRGIWKQQLK